MSNAYLGRIALVTGARTGIGRAIALYLLSQGAEVVGLSRRSGTIEHPAYRHVTCDVGDEAAVARAISEARIKNLDILVNNAGVLESRHSLMLGASQAQEMVMTNLLGPLFVSRNAVRLMRAGGQGRIVNIGSMAAVLEPIGDSVYAATKAGLVSLTNVLAKEYARLGVTCNTIGVTAFESDMLDQLPRVAIDDIVQRLPLPRYAEADDVMNVLDFLCSRRSSYITAQVIYLGGIHS